MADDMEGSGGRDASRTPGPGVEFMDVTRGDFMYGGVVLSGLCAGALALLSRLTLPNIFICSAACFALSLVAGGSPVRYTIANGELTRKTIWRTRRISIRDISHIEVDWILKGGNVILVSDERTTFTIVSTGERSLLFRRELGEHLNAIDSPVLRTVEARKLLGIEEPT